MSPYLEKAYNEGFKAGTVKWKPQLEACEFQVESLGDVLDGKNLVISEQEDIILFQESEIEKLNQKVYNRNIGLAIGIPSAVVVGAVVGLIIRNAVVKKLPGE